MRPWIRKNTSRQGSSMSSIENDAKRALGFSSSGFHSSASCVSLCTKGSSGPSQFAPFSKEKALPLRFRRIASSKQARTPASPSSHRTSLRSSIMAASLHDNHLDAARFQAAAQFIGAALSGRISFPRNPHNLNEIGNGVSEEWHEWR